MIVCSAIVGEGIMIYSHYLTYDSAGLYDLEWKFWDILTRCLIVIPSSFVIGSIDSFRISRRKRLIVMAVSFLFYAYRWTIHRFYSTMWQNQDTCVLLLCGALKPLFLS